MRKIILSLAISAIGLVPAFAQESTKKPAPADVIKLPTPADVKELDVYPKDIQLIGEDDARQLVLTALLQTGSQDLSGDVTYEVADAKIARVSSAGRVMPVANGSTTITAKFGDKTATVKVKVASMDEALPISFANHIVPIFTKLG